LYATILGIAAPWDVVLVELDERAKVVDVWLEEPSARSFGCPECRSSSPLYDHPERSWRLEPESANVALTRSTTDTTSGRPCDPLTRKSQYAEQPTQFPEDPIL